MRGGGRGWSLAGTGLPRPRAVAALGASVMVLLSVAAVGAAVEAARPGPAEVPSGTAPSIPAAPPSEPSPTTPAAGIGGSGPSCPAAGQANPALAAAVPGTPGR
ncbi:MAG TPA: hypothetical protein VKI19_02395, partial [Acidimicrobiales bacterium]|nr:hypothetical protein [Acidimicrobiales bacterium]